MRLERVGSAVILAGASTKPYLNLYQFLKVGDKNCEFVVFVAAFVVILVKIRILLLNYSLPSLQDVGQLRG
ncbi:hypothetical protein ACET3Z_006901 [Daucus carota]